jgi:uncharacterized protein YecE (DUF72 family)
MVARRVSVIDPARPGKVWLGTAGWSYLPDWVGPFYPPGTSQSEALSRYVEAFRFVEVDSTFYAAPAQSTIERWASLMPASFRVSFKAPRELVQDTSLRPPDVPFGHFCRTLMDGLGERFACVVVQMPPSFERTPQNDVALRAFCQQWHAYVPISIELRSNTWMHESVNDVLRAYGIPRVSNDLHDVPDLERNCYDTSNSAAYIRLIGRHDGMSKDRIQRPQDEARRWWCERIGELANRGVRDIYVAANNHYEGHAPATLRTLSAQLRDVGCEVVAFNGFPDGQASLFC